MQHDLDREATIAMANAKAHAKLNNTIDDGSTANPRTELDSHANMCVLGQHAYIFEHTGRTCNVDPFDPSMGSQPNIPLVDGAVAYECPYTSRIYILIIRNALYMPSLDYNLIPPFLMREGGVIVNGVPKIHCSDPSVNDHCLQFEDSSLRIPLQLNGIFSYFHTRKPEIQELYQYKKLFLTPDQDDWNPHCESYENNERSMLDFQGEMADKSHRKQHFPIFNDNDLPAELASVTLDRWNDYLDANISSSFAAMVLDPGGDHDIEFAESINLRAEVSKMAGNIGSVNFEFSDSKNLFDLNGPTIGTWDDLENFVKETLPEAVEDIESKVAAMSADRSNGVSSELLSNLWLVSEDLAEGAIDQTTQLCRHREHNHLSRNYSTNDRMLRYKRLKSCFFSDTMFALQHKSVRQYKCC